MKNKKRSLADIYAQPTEWLEIKVYLLTGTGIAGELNLGIYSTEDKAWAQAKAHYTLMGEFKPCDNCIQKIYSVQGFEVDAAAELLDLNFDDDDQWQTPEAIIYTVDTDGDMR